MKHKPESVRVPQSARALRPLASNRKARHEYTILDTVEAGISLQGTEVKAARGGNIQLKDSYVEFRDGEMFLIGAHISGYTHGNRENHEPERPRKLLLKRREIDKWHGKLQGKGLTVIPLSVHLRGDRVKVEIALAQGKKFYDKREDEKKKELEREARAAMSVVRR